MAGSNNLTIGGTKYVIKTQGPESGPNMQHTDGQGESGPHITTTKIEPQVQASSDGTVQTVGAMFGRALDAVERVTGSGQTTPGPRIIEQITTSETTASSPHSQPPVSPQPTGSPDVPTTEMPLLYGHGHQDQRSGRRVVYASTVVGLLALSAYAYVAQPWDSDPFVLNRSLPSAELTPSPDAPPSATTSTLNDGELLNSAEDDPVTAENTLALGPAENIPIAMARVTYSRNTAIDTDPAPGWQDGVTLDDESMIFTSDVDVRINVTVPDLQENPAISVEDADSSSVKKVTIDLNHVAVMLDIDPQSYLPELTGENGEPIPLLERIVTSSLSTNDIQILKDSGVIPQEATTLAELTAGFDQGVASLVHRANQNILDYLMLGNGRSQLSEIIKNQLIAAYGLDDPLISYQIIPLADPESISDSEQSADYATRIPPSITEDAMQFTAEQPTVTIDYQPYPNNVVEN